MQFRRWLRCHTRDRVMRVGIHTQTQTQTPVMLVIVVPDWAVDGDADRWGSRSRRGFGEDARRQWVGGIEHHRIHP
jgi:hypothetical protein